MKPIEQFYEDIKTDSELQKKLTAAESVVTGDDPRAAFEQILPVIREAGYDFSLEELETYAKEHHPNADGEMSLDELDAVAGGGGCVVIGFGYAKDKYFCFCVIGGASKSGESHADSNKLACALLGL